MATTTGMPPLPPGATTTPPSPALPPLPPGATTTAPEPTDERPLQKLVGTVLGGPLLGEAEGLLPGKAGEFAGDVTRGVGEGAMKTGAGVSRLLHLPTTGALERAGEVGPTAGEKVGDVLENIGEFVAGGEAAKGVAGFLKLATKFPEVLQLVEQYPKASRILMSALGGGAQGTVKAAGEGKAPTKVAEEGAAGAAGAGVGSAAAEAAGPAARWAARKTGLGGLTSLEALVKAGRAYVGERNWEENVKLVTPRLVDWFDKVGGPGVIKTVGDFVDQLHDAAQSLWRTEVQPLVDQNATKMIDGSGIARDIRARITPGMRAMPNVFKSEVDAINAIADDFDNFRFNLKDANSFLVDSLNPKLQSFYKMDEVARRAARLTDGEVSALEAGADGLRDEIYSKLGVPEDQVRQVRREYGALKQMNRVFTKRATVDARQAPLNLAQILSGGAGMIESLTALLSGHPLVAAAGVVPFAAISAQKARQAPASLIRQGLEAGSQELHGPSAVSRAAQGAARAVVPATDRVAGGASEEEVTGPYVRFTASDGTTHEVPEDQLDAARKIDPNLKVEPPVE